jgi:hypothetical protein
MQDGSGSSYANEASNVMDLRRQHQDCMISRRRRQ